MMKYVTAIAAAVLAVTILASSPKAQAEGNNPQARIIRLATDINEPLGAFGNALPEATFTLFNYNNSFETESFNFTVKGLSTVRNREVYALYITTASSAAAFNPETDTLRKYLFNTDFNGTWHLDDGTTDFFELSTLTVFVVREQEDLSDYNHGVDLLILEGTSVLP